MPTKQSKENKQNSKKHSENSEIFCRSEIERMLKNSQSKVIMPVIALGLFRAYSSSGTKLFADSDVRKTYQSAVKDLKKFLGHDIHVGAKYEDAYGMRMSRYGVLKTVGHLKYELLEPYLDCAKALSEWIPGRIKQHIDERLGIVPLLHNPNARVSLAENQEQF